MSIAGFDLSSIARALPLDRAKRASASVNLLLAVADMKRDKRDQFERNLDAAVRVYGGVGVVSLKFNTLNGRGLTMLTEAVKTGKGEFAETLLTRYGADPTAEADGACALAMALAAREAFLTFGEILEAHATRVGFESLEAYVREKYPAGAEALAKRRAETTTDGGRMTEEFDRKRALTPYYGEMRGERVACGVVQTPETESVGEAMRRETRRRAEASEGYGARGAVLEVLLWRDAARSAIHFTIGMTMLLFVRLAPRSTVSGVSLTAYASMAYLAYKYVWAVMFPRLSYGLELNDRAVGDMAQRWAISFNAWASRHRGVLAGRDNSAVFRTFLALYAVSALGHVMSAWAVATTLWVGAFTVPPFFDAYRYSITNAYVTAHIFTSSRFNALSAPKRWIGGLLLGAFAFASVNVKARFCLSFLALVAFRMFRETHVKELAAFENIVRSASRRVSRSMNEFAMILSPAARHRR